ncbi:MFS general substrate transporter [Stemphylium lycopersici]|uniref:MFS general substrate transporter n=1 Tax=Stemphylium lycopersici TaxID=183478 RepID=A0A364N936_STELY|nr:MFS general substrate transporter [Stemphylium lycopersici]
MTTKHHQEHGNHSLSDPEKDAATYKNGESRNHDNESVQTTQSSRHMKETTGQDDKASSQSPESRFADWDGPDDPGNPHNWGQWKRFYHASLPALFGFAVTFGTSVYTPALGDIMRDFDISRTLALVGLTLYTLGLGFGPVMSAPLSESHGRKPVYLIFFPMSMLFTLGAGFSKNIASLCVCRFFAGLFGSPALAVGAGTSSDLFPPHRRAFATSWFLLAPFAGPSLGPVVGGFIGQYKTWQWTQWCMLFVSAAVYAMSLPMSETHKPIILQRRAKKLGVSLKVDTPDMKSVPVVFFVSLYSGFTFGVLFLLFAAFPFVFTRPPYNFTTSQYGLTFLSVGVGVVCGSITTMIVDTKIYQKKYREAKAAGQSYAEPEHRLYSAMMGCWGIVIGLFWFGWCADKGVHWAPTILGAIPFAWGNICVFTSSALYITDVYGAMNGASAIAANGIARYLLGSVFPLFTVQMYDTMGVGWATSLLGFLATAMLPIPFLFFRYGRRIRAQSKYPVVM